MTRLTELHTSPAALADGASLRRVPRARWRPRSASFRASYEDRVLYYDCFRHHESDDVLLVGPPPFNLKRPIDAAQFSLQGPDVPRAAEHHYSRSTMLTRLRHVPAGAEAVHIQLAGQSFDLPIRQNISGQLAGQRVMFTMSKNNDAAWIRDWIAYHRHHHQVTSLIFIDNGSDNYASGELAELLCNCGLEQVVLVSLQHKYGARDSAVLFNKYWAHFLQVSAFNIILRRMGRLAEGLLNCDIDELVSPVAGGTAFDLPARSTYGVASLEGEWVSNATPEPLAGERHRHFWHMRKGNARYLCPRKWVLDPGRDWLDAFDVFPSVHRIFNTPDKRATQQKIGHFWHFEGINTNWKKSRKKLIRPDPSMHFADQELRDALNAVWPG